MSQLRQLAAIALVAIAMPATSFAQSVDDRFPGAWRMITLEAADSSGKMQKVEFSGQIVFTADGHMSVQAMNPDPNAAPTPYTLNGYEATYGRFETDAAKKTFTFNVESSLARDLIGKDLSRVYAFSGNQLILTPTDSSEGWRVVYEKD